MATITTETEESDSVYLQQTSTLSTDTNAPDDDIYDSIAEKRHEEKARNLLDRLLNATDPRIRPQVYGPAVIVKCDFYVESFGPLDSANMEFHMDTYFRQRWRDRRLAFTEQEDPVIVPAHSMDRLWLPELIFPNEKEGNIHQVTVPNKVIKIFPDGTVRYSARMKMKLGCMMDLSYFPHDHQDCFIKVNSYTYAANDVNLTWLNDDPIEIYKEKLKMPEFKLLHTSHDRCKEELTTGAFSCIIAHFHLKREVGFFILQTYLPSVLIVILSWVSFWISKEAVPARITLGVTTVLTMTTQLGTSRSQTMRVSYPKAMDVWHAMCMVFVFGALLEYAFVNVLWRREPKWASSQRRRKQTGSVDDLEEGDSNKNLMELKARTPDSVRLTELSPFSGEVDDGYDVRWAEARVPLTNVVFSATSVDKVSRVIFPAVFVVFNLVYWPLYTTPHHTEF